MGELSAGVAIVAIAMAVTPGDAFAGGTTDLMTNDNKRVFGEMYAEQVLRLPTDYVMRNVRGYANVNGVRVDLEFDRVFLDASRSYIKVVEIKWGQNTAYTENQRLAATQIAKGDIYLTGTPARANGINPAKTLAQQFAYQNVIFTINATRVLRSDITKVRLNNGARLFSHWIVNMTGMH